MSVLTASAALICAIVLGQAAFSPSQPGPPVIQGKVTGYGIFGVSKETRKIIIKSQETPSGRSWAQFGLPILMTPTNRVPAKMGVRFGIIYEINNVPNPDGLIILTKITRYPPIIKPNGTISGGYTSFEEHRVKSGKVVGSTGFEFDHDYELATGDWEFEIQFRGQTICKQMFTVYKESLIMPKRL